MPQNWLAERRAWTATTRRGQVSGDSRAAEREGDPELAAEPLAPKLGLIECSDDSKLRSMNAARAAINSDNNGDRRRTFTAARDARAHVHGFLGRGQGSVRHPRAGRRAYDEPTCMGALEGARQVARVNVRTGPVTRRLNVPGRPHNLMANRAGTVAAALWSDRRIVLVRKKVRR
jgi:hypothetical protein